MKRAQELTPGAQEQAAVLNLVTKIQSVLDNLVVAPSLFEAAVCIVNHSLFILQSYCILHIRTCLAEMCMYVYKVCAFV